MTASKLQFRRKLDRALNSPQLRVALERAMPALGERRNARIKEVDWPTRWVLRSIPKYWRISPPIGKD